MSQRKGTPPGRFSEAYLPPERVGNLESPEIGESSGLSVSPCQPGVFWTHNDSGDGAFIFAFNESGQHLGTWSVSNADNKDWEDLAIRREADGKCYLFIGEIGNNKSEKPDIYVYRVTEPAVSNELRSSSRKQPARTAPADKLTFGYPDGRHDAEALMVHPGSGEIYVVTKLMSGSAGVYKIAPDWTSAEKKVASKVADVSVPAVPNGLLTGGDIAPDGRRVLLTDYFAGYELTLPAAAKSFDDIWSQTPAPINIGERKNGEAVAYSPDGLTIYSTSEGKKAPIYRIRLKNAGQN